VSVVVNFAVLYVAVIDTRVVVSIGVVVMVNAALVAPPGTDIVLGTVTPATFEDNVTDTPAAGAGACSVTTPCVAAPATIDDGVMDTPASVTSSAGAVVVLLHAAASAADAMRTTTRFTAMVTSRSS
jgi:hypothetical protein